MSRPRARDVGVVIGTLPTGTHNAITDVEGVRVGHTTLIMGDGPIVPGVGPVRTGVTAIIPHAGDVFRDKVAAWVHRINGFGEVTNAEQVRELGVLETPILLTGTQNVPRVADAVLDWAFAKDPEMGVSTWGPSPVVAECSDQYLSDVRGRHVRSEHVAAAIEGATGGSVVEGGVGAGVGMSCCEFKGGIGTSSRVVPAEAGGFTVGVLVLSNFGRREHLVINGVPVGRSLVDWRPPHSEVNPDGLGSSIIIVVATDAPLPPRQLERLCVRAGGGLARVGGLVSTTSGDFAIAFSTTNRTAHDPGALVLDQRQVAEAVAPCQPESAMPAINYLFQATLEATEEAILNSMFAAETLVGRDGHVRHALPLDEVLRLLNRASGA
ncbi:MAG TPA: P1 family peptidase [Anaerolineales bacterium]|nr:P1 family peptidase [Anaerolineales bacterium]